LSGKSTLDKLREAQDLEAQNANLGQTVSEVRQSDISRQYDQIDAAKKANEGAEKARRPGEDILIGKNGQITILKKK